MKGLAAIIIIVLALGAGACGPNQRILESANENQSGAPGNVSVDTNTATTVTGFAQDLEAMRTADFKFILVFRRKDGQPLNAGDRELLSKTAPQANRRRLSDEGKAVIIGSNFPFITGTFNALTERFSMEDYSKPDSGPMYVDATPAGGASVPVR